MRATISRTAEVNIQFNAQAEGIYSPDKSQKLLPCESGCGTLLWVGHEIVSKLCPMCWAEHCENEGVRLPSSWNAVQAARQAVKETVRHE